MLDVFLICFTFKINYDIITLKAGGEIDDDYKGEEEEPDRRF